MRNVEANFERVLETVVDGAADARCPPLLAAALRYAVFPGGARVRPQLCVAIAAANRGDDPVLAGAAAAAIELLHCASLVHDDLPCFDAAGERRGKPSVHRVFGEQVALLAGDALIVAAFEGLAQAAGKASHPERLAALLTLIAGGAGAPCGIAAGQAWESEPWVDVGLYHRAKTGALFVAATCAGAAAAGAEVALWRPLGESIGEAYQVADDIQDSIADPQQLGKPVGRDQALGRPSAVGELGLQGAVARLKTLLEEGLEAVPQCPGRDALQSLVRAQSKRFLPKGYNRRAA
jgi:geranylgeranyl diphosphate synthase type II